MPYASLFLITFLGVITGVGGGVIRDVLAERTPSIFVKKIYAVASIAGALLTAILLKNMYGVLTAMTAGALTVILIRILAANYLWDLPRINK